MRVTVAVCTWNRASLLEKTLAKMRRLSIPSDVEWELLVVNNNCSDRSDEAIARHASSLPLRRLFEAKQGLSHARNCAIEHAKGDLVLWTDDDVLVDENWLLEYVRAANRWPQAAFFGGTVDPWFEHEPPSWIKSNVDMLGGPFAVRRLGSEERVIEETGLLPWGANMAMRTAAVGSERFSPALGRCRDGHLLGEEVDRRLGSEERVIEETGLLPWGANMAMVDLLTRLIKKGLAYEDLHVGVLSGSGEVASPHGGGKCRPHALWCSSLSPACVHRTAAADLLTRLIKKGHRGVWVGTARVSHFISANRLTKTYMWEYFRGAGRSRVRMGAASAGPMLFGVPRYLLRVYIEQRLLMCLYSPGKSRRWLQALRRAARVKGTMDELRGAHEMRWKWTNAAGDLCHPPSSRRKNGSRRASSRQSMESLVAL